MKLSPGNRSLEFVDLDVQGSRNVEHVEGSQSNMLGFNYHVEGKFEDVTLVDPIQYAPVKGVAFCVGLPFFQGEPLVDTWVNTWED